MNFTAASFGTVSVVIIALTALVNSKNANTCNADGEQKAQKMTELAAQELGISADLVLVASIYS